MAKKTSIEWCDHTFNTHWGCTKVSPGCENCYAETWSKRLGYREGSKSGRPALWGSGAARRFFGDAHWREPLGWNKQAQAAGVRRRVFASSMADLFEDREDLQPVRDRIYALIQETPHLDWLLLTKRPACIETRFGLLGNVWLGTTVEDNVRAALRIPALLKTPAAVHFLSVEPMLEPLDLRQPVWQQWSAQNVAARWVIIGGESGAGHRPLDVMGMEVLARAARVVGHPVFIKQDSGRQSGRQGRIPGHVWSLKQFPTQKSALDIETTQNGRVTVALWTPENGPGCFRLAVHTDRDKAVYGEIPPESYATPALVLRRLEELIIEGKPKA